MSHVVTYEYGALYYGAGESLTHAQWEDLVAFRAYGGNERYFDVVHRGIQFRSYVGVLTVGRLTIEVLPKLDAARLDEGWWRGRLLDMLGVVHGLTAHHPSTSHLRTRPNNVLEFYLAHFAVAMTRLLRGGLVKQYRARSGNRTALRGRLAVGRHVRENGAHRERFFVADAAYDYDHALNRVLRTALRVARKVAPAAPLRQTLAELELGFPELPPITVDAAWFDRLHYTVRTAAYRPAEELARLLLLNVQPGLERGERPVVALLVDMNRLWEGFVVASLRRYGVRDVEFAAQYRGVFWRGTQSVHLQPDILVRREDTPLAVLDVKWKQTERPSSAELYQLYAYAHHFGVPRVALLYPTLAGDGAQVQGLYGDFTRCDLLHLPTAEGDVDTWMETIAGHVNTWLQLPDCAPPRQSAT